VAEAEPNSEPTRSPQPEPQRPRIRWWPLWLIAGATVATITVVWLAQRLNHQERNLRSLATLVCAMALAWLWCLAFSRLRWRTRLVICGSVVALGLLAGTTLRIRGVTGDLLPVLEWRWQGNPPPPAGAVVKTSSALPSATVAEASYPQFLGPNRNGTVNAMKLARDWTQKPPRIIWRHSVGAAWSGFAVTGPYALTQEQRGSDESVTCCDLATGRQIWSAVEPSHYNTVIAGEGPRATPTIVGQRVYAMGATGHLTCLDLATGKRLWSHDVLTECQSRQPEWGVACSPLVWKDLVIVSSGGQQNNSLVAYQTGDGALAWAGGDDDAGYSSPVAASLLGVEQVLIFNGGNVAGHDRLTGKVLWRYRWPRGHPHVASPLVVSPSRIVVSSGYGTGSELVELHHDPGAEWSATRVWKSNRLKAKFTDLVVREGFIYGLDDGILACLDLATGEQKWKEGRYGHGQVILVSDVLLISAETGDVVLVEATPAEHRELARFNVFQRKTWNPPALAGRFLLMRNDAEAACLELSLAP